jgi:hypothetical protein
MSAADTGPVEPGPWIFETMIGERSRNHGTGELTMVECPGPACDGLLVELVDGRIGRHDSRREVPCPWAGVRIIACPGKTAADHGR